jgi:hypothetical protein
VVGSGLACAIVVALIALLITGVVLLSVGQFSNRRVTRLALGQLTSTGRTDPAIAPGPALDTWRRWGSGRTGATMLGRVAGSRLPAVGVGGGAATGAPVVDVHYSALGPADRDERPGDRFRPGVRPGEQTDATTGPAA